MEKVCVICGGPFQAKRDSAKYCSKVCANHSRFSKTFEQIREENEELKRWVVVLNEIGLNDREIGEVIGKCSSWAWQRRRELGILRAKSKRQREIERLEVWRENFKTERRTCARCGAEFSPVRDNQRFCSDDCRRKQSHEVNDIKRKRLEKKQAVDDISLNDVFVKFGGICYLCGGKCDYNAVRIVNGVPHALGDYPSREHIRPLSKGGLHTWDNIQLAHVKCNSSKGARLV